MYNYQHETLIVKIKVKEDGRIASMPEFVVDGTGKEIRAFSI